MHDSNSWVQSRQIKIIEMWATYYKNCEQLKNYQLNSFKKKSNGFVTGLMQEPR